MTISLGNEKKKKEDEEEIRNVRKKPSLIIKLGICNKSGKGLEKQSRVKRERQKLKSNRKNHALEVETMWAENKEEIRKFL